MSSLPSWVDSRWLRLFRQRILRWYEQNHRSLPWRTTDSAYAIWVSEIMLQQTQVATVLPYYARFLQRFQTIESLANAEETEVLKYWEGLGYYRRARQMHAAAHQIVAMHQGDFPTKFDDVLNLPGIGRYTAGAICSFAYDQPTPIVEANTQRLYSRLLRIEQPLTEKESQVSLWNFARQILPRKNGRMINQAVMELGSLVCQPKPLCQECPLMEMCPSFAQGLQSVIPAPKRKTKYEDRHEAALIIVNSRRKVLIRQCAADEWWAGLWDFPRFEVEALNPSSSLIAEVKSKARLVFDFDCNTIESLFCVKHSVTKYRITLACFRASLVKTSKFAKQLSSKELSGQPCRWASLTELDSIPLSASGRRVVQKLEGARDL